MLTFLVGAILVVLMLAICPEILQVILWLATVALGLAVCGAIFLFIAAAS